MPLEHAPQAATERAETSEARGPIGYFALKHRDTFLVADSIGDVWGGGDGLFRNDTRVLSRWRVTIGGAPPSLLGASVSRDNVFFRANLTNRPLPQLGDHSAPEGVIHVERARFLWDERLYERLTLTNYGEREVPAALTIEFAADFRDIFEVRGYVRAARGRLLPAHVHADRVVLAYEGLDGVVRASHVVFSHPPHRLSASRAEFNPVLKRHTQIALHVEVGASDSGPTTAACFREAAARARVAMRRRRRRGAAVHTPARAFNVWLDKARADIALLTTDLPTGPYPYAGIPWFSTTFGRDAIVTALQMLWVDPSLARGVLAFLADTQAHEWNAFADAAPGKIMHEARKGEVTARNELPFRRYYGGVDTTPLFVMLAGAYAERTADLQFVDRLWPTLIAAMEWIEGAGDSNGDGFVDYARGEDTGPREPGMEGQRRLGVSRGRAHAAWTHRARRGARLRLRGSPGDGDARDCARRARVRRALALARRCVARRRRSAFLDAQGEVLRDRARR